MKSARSVLYGVAGLLIGWMLGLILAYSVFQDMYNSVAFYGTSVVPIGMALIGAFAGWLLGRKTSDEQKRAPHEGGRSDFFVANNIAGVYLISSITMNFVANLIVPILFQNPMVGLLLYVAISAISAVLGVWYVVRKKYLLPSHNPTTIALWTVGLLGIAAIVLSLISGSSVQDSLRGMATTDFLINGIVMYAVIHFLCQKALAHGSNVSALR